MEELQLALTSARVDQRNFGLWINNWQVGQTLNALVLGQRPGGELVLRVGGQQITATADIPVQQGANLLLEVKQLRPVPTLRVLNPAPEAGAARLNGTLQLMASTSTGMATPPLATVAQAVQAVQARGALPAGVVDALSQMLRQISRPERLTQPEGIARAFRESGLLFESHLRAGAQGTGPMPVPATDLKASLLRSLARVDAALARVEALALTPAGVEDLLALKRELEGGLGRVTVHQLNSVPQDPGAGRHWQLEIPVQVAGDFHNLRIELEEERRRDHAAPARDDEEAPWRVTLKLAPEAIGAVEVRLRLQGDEVSARFAAARPEIRHLFDAGMLQLTNALASRGITLMANATAALPERRAGNEAVQATGSMDLHA